LGALLAALGTDAQDVSSVHVKGKVLDMWNKEPVSGVSVINPKLGQSTVTDGAGRFDIYCGKRDTLFLFLSGYQTVRFSMADSVDQPFYHPTFEFDKLNTTFSRAIIVHPKITLEDIEKERKEMGRIPRELKQPEMSISSPISALYDLLSSRAKERSKLREQIQEDERRRIYRELFNYYKEEGLFDLPDEHYEPFITYLNLPVDFLKYNTDYTIMKTILDAYKKYGVDKGFIR
jgi:hypothetical protein